MGRAEEELMKYLITYDLHAPVQNYKPLIMTIKEYGKWAKIGQSSWIVKTEKSAISVRDNLKQHIDKNDKLFVCAFSGWASYGLSEEVTDLLKK